MTEQRKFRRHLDSLADIFDFIEQFTSREHVDDATKRAFDLAVDELFTNSVRYHPSNENHIAVQLTADGQTMVLRFSDHDVDPFDVTAKPDPDVTASLSERTPGGLGIYLMKKVVDEVLYEYDNRTSVTILKKNYRRKNV